jgi:hypothetical protein
MDSLSSFISAAQARELILSGNAPVALNVRDLDKAIHGTVLNLSNQVDLNALPEGLTVWGDLNLSGCTSLDELPRGLVIKTSLRLNNCTGLQKLPDDLLTQTKRSK